jgi:hypothetical protein
MMILKNSKNIPKIHKKDILKTLDLKAVAEETAISRK